MENVKKIDYFMEFFCELTKLLLKHLIYEECSVISTSVRM